MCISHSVMATLEQCLSKVHDWLLHNGLSPNPAKSNAVQFATGRGRRDEVESISVSGAAIKPASLTKSQESRVLGSHLIVDCR